MNTIKLIPTYVSSSDLSSVPIENGRQIICKDNGMQFIDYNNTRILITQIIFLNDDMERESMSSPINGKFYFVKDSQVLYFYHSNTWICLSITSGHPISGVTPGTYVTVTVDKNGHVTDGNNDPISIDYGGTGANTAETARDNLGITSIINEINNTIKTNNESVDARLDYLEESVQQILTQINDIRLTYTDGSFYMSSGEGES